MDREAQDELAYHLELAAADKAKAGLDTAEARRQARLELGNPEEARERLREGRTGFALDALLKDIALAVRALRKRPAFAAICIVTVAMGVGASTALFAVVDAVVLKPLPLPDPAALVRIYDTNLPNDVERSGVTSGNLGDWRRRVRRLQRHRRTLHDGAYPDRGPGIRGGADRPGHRELLSPPRRGRGDGPDRSPRRRPGSPDSTARRLPSAPTRWSCSPTASGAGDLGATPRSSGEPSCSSGDRRAWWA